LFAGSRLKGAMTSEPVGPAIALATVDIAPDSEQIFTPSEVELEAFQVIRAILRPVVKPGRIVIRDAASYCAILFDDNNRKPVCRLRFNNESRLVVGFFNENKEEEKVPIAGVDQLFDFSDRLRATVDAYVAAGQIKENAGDVATA
jgi:predicted type IV restriction endonuclease